MPKKTERNAKKDQLIVETIINYKAIVQILCIFSISFVITFLLVSKVPELIIRLKKSVPKPDIAKRIAKTSIFQVNDDSDYIDAVILKGYIDEESTGYLLIDSRSKEEYDAGHIKNAINLPLYLDYQSPYKSVVEKTIWTAKVKKAAAGKQIVIAYSYSKENNLLMSMVKSLRKERYPIKALSVGWGDWLNLPSWLPGADLSNGFSYNSYVIRNNQ